MSKEVEFLVKLRDACTMIADAANEYLDTKTAAKTWSPGGIAWTQTEGTKGPYERYPTNGQKIEVTTDYKELLAELKSHDGKLFRDGFFYWLFQDASTVGRKKRRPRGP